LVELGHAFDLHIAMLELPLVVLLEQDGTYEADDAVLTRAVLQGIADIKRLLPPDVPIM